MTNLYVESFINKLKAAGVKSENTIQSYYRDLNQAAAYFARHDQNLAEIKNHNIESYIDSMRTSGKSDATICRTISSMRTFYKYMMDNGFMDYNPALIVNIPKITSRRYTHGENLKLPEGDSLKTVRDRAMVKLITATGIKATALINITMYDVEYMSRFEKRIIEEYLAVREELIKEKDTMALFVNTDGNKLTRQGLWKILNNYRTEKQK